MQPQKLKAAPSAGPAAEPVTAESLGWQLRAALPPMRLHSVSLYDARGNVLWLSEGALGPDEHNLVIEASEVLAEDTSQPYHECGMEDGRIAVFLPVRAPKGDLVGLGMILADLKSLPDGVAERMATPQVRTILQKVAVLLRVTTLRSDGASETAIVAALPEAEPLELEPRSIASAEIQPAPAVGRASHGPGAGKGSAAPAVPPRKDPAPAASPFGSELLTPAAVEEILELELVPDAPPPAPAPPPPEPQKASSSPASNGGTPPPAHRAPAPAPASARTTPITKTTAPKAAPLEEAPRDVPVVQAAPAAPRKVSTTAIAPRSSAYGAASSARSTPPAPAPAPAPAASAPSRAPAPPSRTGTTGTMPGISRTRSTVLDLPASPTERDAAADLVLYIQQLAKLRSSGRTRRYEVLARSRSATDTGSVPAAFLSEAAQGPEGSTLDGIVVQKLLAWLGENPTLWESDPMSFTVNLSLGAIEDGDFPQLVASCLEASGVAPEHIGFEVPESACVQRRQHVERFMAACEKIGCFVVLDDFSMDSAAVPFLRSKALKLVKIDTRLTANAMKDKLAQALVVAVSQAAKVLGLHCVAKRVETQQSVQWLSAVGCDFAQGFALEKPRPLETLTSEPAADT